MNGPTFPPANAQTSHHAHAVTWLGSFVRGSHRVQRDRAPQQNRRTHLLCGTLHPHNHLLRCRWHWRRARCGVGAFRSHAHLSERLVPLCQGIRHACRLRWLYGHQVQVGQVGSRALVLCFPVCDCGHQHSDFRGFGLRELRPLCEWRLHHGYGRKRTGAIFIVAYDIWNFCCTYNCLPTHSFSRGFALPLAPTVANALWNKGGWIQNRANPLATWCMFAQVFPWFQEESVFRTVSVQNPTITNGVAVAAPFRIASRKVCSHSRKVCNPALKVCSHPDKVCNLARKVCNPAIKVCSFKVLSLTNSTLL